jgi:ubiquinone/menaquinone biosynthesis C-methylase UbiE
MHPTIYQEFERICAARGPRGRVLEVGAVANEQSLLAMKSLRDTSEKIGINLTGPHTYKDFSIVGGNANDMRGFADGSFDVVLSNATLEHDKCFWKTVAEIHRVTRPGGLIVIGVPGFVMYRAERQIKRLLTKTPLLRRARPLISTTITYQIHNAPGDYYRFSLQALKEVFFDGCYDVRLTSLMVPPRIIGSGIRA